MIINNFGWRLGNQMFQIATAVAVTERDGGRVFFPKWDYADMFEGGFIGADRPGAVKRWKEPGFHFTEIPVGTTLIDGYFQSEKYFKDYDSKIRNMFTIKKDIRDALYEKHK